MTKKWFLQVVGIVCLLATVVLPLSRLDQIVSNLKDMGERQVWTLGARLLHAREHLEQSDTPAQTADKDADADDVDADSTVVRDQIFLPFVIDGNPGDLSAVIGPDEPNQPIDGHDHGQPIFESWPPQPIGIDAIAQVPIAPPDSVAGAALLATEDAMGEAERVALTSAAVQAALGASFVHATTTRIYSKADGPTANNPGEIRVVYFSYTNNQTVEAVVIADMVDAVHTYTATAYQPEPTRVERDRAIELARAHLLAAGESRVAQLKGYGIMAYRSNGRTGFYNARVVYVTFHAALDERPEYLAWVDLTNEQILKFSADSLELHAAKASPTSTADTQLGADGNDANQSTQINGEGR